MVGWKEKDNRANLLFGRCFELALGAYFRREDSAGVLFAEWAKYREADIEFSHGDTWDRMFRQGVQLLERLAQYDRIEITRHVHGNWCSTHSSYFIDWRSEDLSSFE